MGQLDYTFRRCQDISRAEQDPYLRDLLTQAQTAGDIKTVQGVYRYAPYRNTVKRDALLFVLEHARKTGDRLLVCDVYQHAGGTDLSQTILDTFEQIAGKALTH